MEELLATIPSYVWQAPGKRVSVSLSLEVVEFLDMAVMEAFQSLPRRGLEVGGFLLGKTRREGKDTVVEIDRFEPLESEHAVGPSYLLSATDREALERGIRAHASGSGLSIVGFYRSNTRKDFALTIEDADLMSDYFAKTSMVFLLIHMQRGRPPMGAFSLWEGPNLLSMTPSFPFRKAALAEGGFEICNRASVLNSASEKSIQAQPSSDLAEETNLRPAASPVQQALVAATVLPAQREPQNPAIGPPTLAQTRLPQMASRPPLAPKRNTGSRLRLSLRWLLAASILLIAVLAGILHLSTVPAETLSSAPPVANPTPEVSAVQSPPAVEVAKPTTPAETAAAPAPEESRTTTPRETRNFRHGDRARMETPITGFAVPSPKPAAVKSSEPMIPHPPELASDEPDSASASRSSEILPPRTPQAYHQFVNVTVDRPSRPHVFAVLGKLPLIGKRFKRTERSDFVPPTPVREAPTVLPAELRRGIQHEVPIAVKVYVNRAGKVEFAELLSKPTEPNRELANLAVSSARQWEFSPAHLGDDTVPAEVVLRFRFGPDTH